MSTSKTGDRKSASFTREEFEKQWSELTKSVAESKHESASGADKKTPVMKTREKEKEPVIPTVTQTDTGDTPRLLIPDGLTHTPPTATPRSKKIPRQLNFASDVKFSDGASQSPRKLEKLTESPRRTHITPRKAEQSQASESPEVTPRGRDEKKLSAAHQSPAGKFRKQASRKFADMKLNLSGLSEKLSANRHSPSPSPGSSGRISPSKISPRKKTSHVLKDVSVKVRNQIAKAYLKLQEDAIYAGASEKRKSILLNAKMIGVLAENNIAIDEKKLQALAADAEIRSKNLLVDRDVDLTDPEYSDFCRQAADAAFVKPWNHDASDISDPNGKPMGDRTTAKPTFIRDFRNSVYQIKEKDGAVRTIASIDEFLAFFSSHENKDIGMIVSNIASQNLGIFLKNVLFRRQDSNGQYQSVLRLSDGTPLQPLANFKATYTLSKDSNNNVIIDYESHCDQQTGRAGLRASKLQANPQNIAISEDAQMTINTRVVIAADGQWSIDDPHIYAEFWNTEKEV